MHTCVAGVLLSACQQELTWENASFETVSSKVVDVLSPVEQLSPFKLGQIQKLISQIAESAGNTELGDQIAPYFAVGMVIFLVLFVAYFVLGVVSLAVDAEAMDAPCAEDSWIWLYVLLVIVIPTSVGFIIGLVETGLKMIEALKDVKYEIFLVLPSPLLNVTLGILGIVLWSGMTEECSAFYDTNHGLLLVIFHLQVIIMCVSSIFGCITLFGYAASLYADLTKKADYVEPASHTHSA